MFALMISLALKNLLYLALHLESGGKYPKNLSAEEETDCIIRMTKGDKSARDKLIAHNLRLVAYIVNRHYSDSKEPEDLISIGTIGLIRAADTFKSDRNIRFSTYAGTCIENQIKMHFRKDNKHSADISLNETSSEDKDGNSVTIENILKDPSSVAESAELNDNIHKLYIYINKHLTGKEKFILCKRYGLNADTGVKVDKELTQQQVAKLLGISRSYVSRIEKKAMETLRSHFLP